MMLGAALMALSMLCPAPNGAFAKSEVAPDGTMVVCLTDHDTAGKYELYSVPSTGGQVVKLSLEMASNRDVILFEISPNSGRVAFTCDPTVWTKYDLYTVSVVGGNPRKMNGYLPMDHDVDQFAWSGDSERVVWAQGRNTTGDWQLYSAPHGGGMALFLSHPGYTVGRAFSMVWGGAAVRFQSEPLGAGGVMPWYVVSANGGRIMEELFRDGFESGTTGGWR